MIQLHTPGGILSVDVLNPTPEDLTALNITRKQFDQVYAAEIQAEHNQQRLEELRAIFADCHSSHVIPPPGLTEFVILICEYITRSQPR